ncbi:hypothetical protein J3E68DRAFT_374241 [Trichoderma sp. SZMC 28012]
MGEMSWPASLLSILCFCMVVCNMRSSREYARCSTLVQHSSLTDPILYWWTRFITVCTSSHGNTLELTVRRMQPYFAYSMVRASMQTELQSLTYLIQSGNMIEKKLAATSGNKFPPSRYCR